MKLYLTRHGQREWNLEGRMQGRLNSDLTPLGVEQAKWLGHRLNEVDIDVICSSTSGRAVDTAKHIRGNRQITLELYEDLQEIDVGHWQGMTFEDVEGNYTDDFHHYRYKPELFKPKNQETFEAIIERAGTCIESIVKKHAGKDILIVSHGVLLKAFLAYIKKSQISEFWHGPFMNSTCLNIVEVNNGQYEIILEGDTSHYV